MSEQIGLSCFTIPAVGYFLHAIPRNSVLDLAFAPCLELENLAIRDQVARFLGRLGSFFRTVARGTADG